MEPHMGRVAVNIGVLLVVLSILPLPFISMDSAEFVVDVIALAISLVFLAFVTWEVRRQVKLAVPPGSESARAHLQPQLPDPGGDRDMGGFHAEILKEPVRWENGYIIPPTKPGLGVELDEEVAADHPA